ncbi:hypothetical protein OG474_36005 [Kribbella sp. NBC_01505]|uniref:hypothetical protein n=1 Tax=Kribbella sp. NBC_01505 TaxID=2903580 RepID=UPI00387037BF
MLDVAVVGGSSAGLQAALTLRRASRDRALFAIGAAGHASTTAVALHADLLDRDLVQ